MPSAKPPLARSAAVAACICLLGAGAAGCSTTQEKAAAKQLESEQIIKEQAAKKAERKREKQKSRQKEKGK